MIYYVTGVTCAGKDTMMERAADLYPNLVGLVQVGKEFRRRYPPGYFKGKGAMQSTEAEALEIFNQQLEAVKNKKIIFVSSQPRLVSQISFTVGKHPGTIVWMNVSEETLLKRLERRFPNDPESIGLSMKRLSNDRIDLYDVIFNLMKLDIPFITFDGDFESVDSLIHNLVHFSGE